MNIDFLQALMAECKKDHEEQKPVDTDLLTRRYLNMQEKYSFIQGQLIEWKEGMSNKKIETPAIVSKWLDEPLLNAESSSGYTYFREPLDMIIGFIDSDGDYFEMYVDSRRFQPVN